MIKTTLEIEGMGCGMCEANLNYAVRKVYPDAKKVKSSHKKGETTFITDVYPDEAKLQKSVESFGYKILSVKAEITEEKNTFGKGGKTEMKADYKNWVPKSMVFGALAATAVSIILLIVSEHFTTGKLHTFCLIFLSLIMLASAVCSVMFISWYQAFSYKGRRKLSKHIVEGIAEYVKIPDGGCGLDVGCGSGALTIACAKRNPKAQIIGIDRWGKDYKSFSKALCERNAKAEGVNNTSFQKGDATALDFPDECFDCVTSNYVYHNITGANKQALLRETLRVLKKGGTFAIHDLMSPIRYGNMQKFVSELKKEGYENVELIDTTNNMFMSRRESIRLQLGGSTLLTGRK